MTGGRRWLSAVASAYIGMARRKVPGATWKAEKEPFRSLFSANFPLDDSRNPERE